MFKHKTQKTGINSSLAILDTVKQFRLHSSDNRATIEDFFISLDSPISLSCYMLYVYHEYEQLVNKDVNPDSYLDATSFADDFAAISFLRKNSSLKTGINLKGIALQNFWRCEEQCKESNQEIRLFGLGLKKLTVDEYTLSRIQRKIQMILGDFDIDYVLDHCRWGPGSTLSVTGSETSQALKFDIDCDITRDAYDLFSTTIAAAFPQWKSIETPKFVVGNKIITVPKNAKTDRTIAIEPGMNSFIQLGIGALIRKRLRIAGYNLNSDAKNIRGAYKGSLYDNIATIDFKAASDTISIKLVELLLPEKWFRILNAARSHYFTLDKVTHRSNKFSTMGNGFTFELESLIFLSIGLALCEVAEIDDSDVSIFGDDLIVPCSIVTQLHEVCTAFGFTINTEKSFSQGPFRESCGSYFFNGVDVKPIFLKKDILYVKDIFRLANAVRIYSHRRAFQLGCDCRYRSAWSRLVHRIPKPIRFMGPISSGDATIHENISESSPQSRKDGWCGYNYTGLPNVVINTTRDTHGLLLARLASRSTEQSYGNDCSLRAKTRIILKKKMFVSQWYNFGPWINLNN
jgi:hypothetical protein